MKTFNKTAILATLISIVFNSCTIAQQNYSEMISSQRKQIKKIMKKNKIPGASIALVSDNKIIWSEGFGYSDKENQVKATEKTIFRIGSVTKTFTCAAIMQMHEKGLLNIDDKVTKYIPELNIKSRFNSNEKITIRQLLTHHAGLPTDIFNGTMTDSFDNLVDYLNEEYLCFKPGEIGSYSNVGVALLGTIVSKVSGLSYSEYMKQNIFSPLEMNNSFFFGKKQQEAKGYNPKGNQEDDYEFIRDIPAGAICSSAEEMGKYIIEMLPDNKQEKILSSKIKSLIFTKQNKDAKLDFGKQNGLIWGIYDVDDLGTIYAHTGATSVFYSRIVLVPSQNIGIILLTNSANGYTFKNLLYKILKETSEIKSGNKLTVKKEQHKEEIKYTNFNYKKHKKYIGTYVLPGMILDVSSEKEKKLMVILDGFKLQLLPLENGKYLPKAKLAFISKKIKNQRFYFEEINGNTLLINENFSNNSTQILGVKVENNPIPEIWKKRTGKYEITNNQNKEDNLTISDFELIESNGILVLQCKAQMYNEESVISFGLGIHSDKLAYVLGYGRMGGQIVKVIQSENNEKLLYYSGYKLRKLQ